MTGRQKVWLKARSQFLAGETVLAGSDVSPLPCNDLCLKVQRQHGPTQLQYQEPDILTCLGSSPRAQPAGLIRRFDVLSNRGQWCAHTH